VIYRLFGEYVNQNGKIKDQNDNVKMFKAK